MRRPAEGIGFSALAMKTFLTVLLFAWIARINVEWTKTAHAASHATYKHTHTHMEHGLAIRHGLMHTDELKSFTCTRVTIAVDTPD